MNYSEDWRETGEFLSQDGHSSQLHWLVAASSARIFTVDATFLYAISAVITNEKEGGSDRQFQKGELLDPSFVPGMCGIPGRSELITPFLASSSTAIS